MPASLWSFWTFSGKPAEPLRKSFNDWIMFTEMLGRASCSSWVSRSFKAPPDAQRKNGT